MKFEVPVPEISVETLKQRIDASQAPIIIDVREPHELTFAQLPPAAGVIHIPMGQLPVRLKDLESKKDEEIAVLCRSGMRSEMVTNFLLQNGFKKVFNIAGGILAWCAVDASVKPY